MKDPKKTFIYYLILFLLLLSTWDREEYIPMPLRVAFLTLVFLPVLKRVSLYFPCLVLFLTTSLLSYAGYTFMPTEPIIYLSITALFAGMAFRNRRNYQFPYLLLLLLITLTIFVNFLEAGKFEKISFSLLIMSLIPITIGDKDKRVVVEIVPKLFIVTTVAVAILTLLNQQLLVIETYNYERLVSGSLNYTCCTLGVGFILALREFIKPTCTKLWRVVYASSMIVLLLTIVMEASRGAMLGVVIATVLIVLNRNSKLSTKIIVVIFAVIVVMVLYNNLFFDLLIYRIQNDTGTGTGRTGIWADKLNVFLTSSSFFETLFGVGFEKTWNFGGGGASYVGCHNDFVAFFIEYGLFGSLLFLFVLGYPIFAAKTKQVRSDIIPLLAYIVVTCTTLEPFSMGYLPFCFVLLFIYLRVSERTILSCD